MSALATAGIAPADLLAPARLAQRAVLGATHAWSWHEVHAAAAELAQRLPAGAAVCNLCGTRVGFLVTWLAALRRGALVLLPPSGGQGDLLSLLDRHGCTAVVDDETLLQPLAGSRRAGLIYLPRPPGTLPGPAALAFRVDPDAPCACLHTSGSTGAPQPQFKTWRQLVLGAQALAQRLDRLVDGGLADWRALVCSVPPQHMFGLEASVMLSIATGLPVLDRRPLLPLDVRAAFDHVGGPAAWIATPLHLRALAQAGEALPHCRLVLASTMPLAPGLAGQVEALVRAPVVEIFGSTETGVLATRRTAQEARWQPAPGVRLARSGAVVQASAAQFPSPSTLADQVEIGVDGRFTLIGRDADVVKIGGRRASLTGLNLLLQDLPGLADGVFYLPPTQAPTERLVLVHAGAIDRAAAERWLRQHIDPVFLPRAWLQVERLPRDANGKLPRAALDALVAAHKPLRTAAPAALDFEFQVPADHPALPGHFPGRPVVPGVVVLDRVIAHLQQRTGRAVVRLPRVKFSAPLCPGETASVRFTPREATLAFRVSRLRADGTAQTVADGSLVLATAAEAAA